MIQMNTSEFETVGSLGNYIAEGLGIGVLCLDADLKITYWNSWLEKHSGIKQSAVTGDSIIERFPDIRKRNKASYLTQCVEKSIPSILSAYLHQYLIPLEVYKAGEKHLMMQNVKIYPQKASDGSNQVVIIIEDKTEAILHEKAIEKLTRLLGGIRDINKLIVNVPSEKDLLAGACNILSEQIGLNCAWVGYLTENSMTLVPEYANGIPLEKLQQLTFTLDQQAFVDCGDQGPLPGISVNRTAANNQAVWEPWLQVSDITGSQSFCALPIRADGRAYGAISVHAKSKSFFDKDVETLMREIASDASFGLEVLKEKELRRDAEKRLEEERQKLLVTLRSIGDGVLTTDNSGRVVMMNTIAEQLTGWKQEEAVGQLLEQVFHIVNEMTRATCENLVKKVLTTRGIIGLANHTLLISRDGREIPIIDSGAPILTNDGEIIGVVLVFQDDTKRRASQQAIEESEKKYRNIFENIQDVYYEASMDGTILEISPSIEKVLGYKRKELIGKSLYDIYTNPEERDELLEAILESGKIANFEVHLTDKDGSQYSVELNSTLQRDQKGNTVKIIGSMRDISERKRLEAMLRQSQKMEAIGSLAGGIAHEFNNILGTIIGNTELAINDVPESNPARECLEEIQLASLRAKEIVRQLLGFARKSVFQLMPVQISSIVSETLNLIRASIPTTIEIRRNISCKSDTVMADSSQINLVLLNLCANAKNAMQEEGGVLEVNLENTTLDETSAARYEGLGPGNYLKLTVKDSGHGIDPKIIDRIFEPYFTTTSLAEGTGMGLAVVHGIVKNHNGAITVASEPGKGTVFEVLFPLTEAKMAQEAGEPEALPTGNEKILFVDDETSLVKMAKRMLEMQGYRVEAKSDPIEVLELVRSEPRRFDLVITDMTMPQMTGDKLAKEILNIRPGMPIILCSGYSENIDAEKARALGIRKYIEKPLNMSNFVASIRKVLDAGGGVA